MKKQFMLILQKKKVILVKDKTYIRNHDSKSGIYLTAAKVEQYILVDENKREREEAKK